MRSCAYISRVRVRVCECTTYVQRLRADALVNLPTETGASTQLVVTLIATRFWHSEAAPCHCATKSVIHSGTFVPTTGGANIPWFGLFGRFSRAVFILRHLHCRCVCASNVFRSVCTPTISGQVRCWQSFAVENIISSLLTFHRFARPGAGPVKNLEIARLVGVRV